MTYTNKEEQNKKVKEWKKANPEKVRAIKKRSYEKHKEEYKAQSLRQFQLKKLNPEWVEKDKQRRKLYNQTQAKKQREWLQELKRTLFCCRCGMNQFECLDFHHRNPNEKEKNISWAFRRWGQKRILAEITKCDVLCSNCHRTFHYKERKDAGLKVLQCESVS